MNFYSIRTIFANEKEITFKINIKTKMNKCKINESKIKLAKIGEI